MEPTLTASYRVADGPVRLRVVVGNGQRGRITVLVDTEVFAEGPEIDIDLGRGPELANRVVTCSTEVVDVQPATDHVSVSYFLSGGHRPQMWQSNGQLEEGHPSVFQAVFSFRV